MSIVKPYIDNLNNIMGQLEEVAEQAVESNLDVIEYMIVEKQLHQGLNSEGKIAGTYAPATEEYAKDPHNRPRMDKNAFTPFNFDWSGSFIDGIYVELKQYGFDILTRDGKKAMLERKYGKLLKLTKEHNEQVNKEIIMPDLYKYLFKNLFRR